MKKTTLSTTAYYNKFHRNWHKLHDVDLDDDRGNGGADGPQGNTSISKALTQADGLALLKGQATTGTLRVRK